MGSLHKQVTFESLAYGGHRTEHAPNLQRYTAVQKRGGNWYVEAGITLFVDCLLAKAISVRGPLLGLQTHGEQSSPREPTNQEEAGTHVGHAQVIWQLL